MNGLFVKKRYVTCPLPPSPSCIKNCHDLTTYERYVICEYSLTKYQSFCFSFNFSDSLKISNNFVIVEDDVKILEHWHTEWIFVLRLPRRKFFIWNRRGLLLGTLYSLSGFFLFCFKWYCSEASQVAEKKKIINEKKEKSWWWSSLISFAVYAPPFTIRYIEIYGFLLLRVLSLTLANNKNSCFSPTSY